MFEILEPFFNILTADDKYSLHNSDNLQRPIQIQLPKGKKTFSKCLISFLKYFIKFKYTKVWTFWKKR